MPQLDGPVLHSELRDMRSSHAPFYATLTAHGSGGFSFYDIPIEYGPVIQHKPTVSAWVLCVCLCVGGGLLTATAVR